MMSCLLSVLRCHSESNTLRCVVSHHRQMNRDNLRHQHRNHCQKNIHQHSHRRCYSSCEQLPRCPFPWSLSGCFVVRYVVSSQQIHSSPVFRKDNNGGEEEGGGVTDAKESENANIRTGVKTSQSFKGQARNVKQDFDEELDHANLQDISPDGFEEIVPDVYGDEITENIVDKPKLRKTSAAKKDKSIDVVNRRPVYLSPNGVLSPETLKTAIHSHVSLVSDGVTCFTTVCPANKKRSNKLFINKQTGYFICQHCQREGNWTSLQENLMKIASIPNPKSDQFVCMEQDETVTKNDFTPDKSQAALKSATKVKDMLEENYTEFQELFRCHGITQDTMAVYNVHYDSKTKSVLFPYYLPDGSLMGVKKMKAQTDRLRPKATYISQCKWFSLFGWNCFGYNRNSKSNILVLTANEFDAIAVSQSTSGQVLSLPKGIAGLPIQVLPSLEKFKKIYLWFGNEIDAWDAAKTFADKLGAERCFVLRPNPENTSPLLALQTGKELLSIIRKSNRVFHESILTFESLREHIRLELSHAEVVSGIKWKRYPTLNKLLKGHRRGELTVFTGPTGSGKTTFISEYSLDLCMQGVSTLFGSFEITNTKLSKLMLTQFALKNLSTNLHEYDMWADSFQQLPVYFMAFHGQESYTKVIETMTHAVYIHDVTHIVLDNLQFMMGVSSEKSDRFTKQDTIIGAFRNFATKKNCHVTLIIHPRKENSDMELTTASIFGSAKSTQEADNVIILQDKRLSGTRGRKYIQVTKNRFDGELGVLMLKFDPDSKTYSQTMSVKPRKPEEEEDQPS